MWRRLFEAVTQLYYMYDYFIGAYGTWDLYI